MDLRSVLTSSVVEGALFSETGETSAERLRQVIEELELLYYRTAFSGAAENGSPEGLEFLENAALHLVNVVTRRSATLEDEESETAFAVAAFVFELLARSGPRLRSDEMSLTAALCSNLSGLFANASVLLRDVLGDVFSPTYSIQAAYSAQPRVRQLSVFVLLLFLARGLRPIEKEERWIRGELDAGALALASEGEVDSEAVQAALAFVSLARAALEGALFLVSGDETHASAAERGAAGALELARNARDVDSNWWADLFLRVLRRSFSNSTWRLLGGSVPREYLLGLAGGLTPIVELWPPQAQALRGDEESGGGYLEERFKRVFVNMPTSAGKSLLAEFAIVHELLRNPTGGLCFYVVPSRALINEVTDRLSERLFDIGVPVRRVVSGYDELGFESVLMSLAERSVIVVTPEKLSLFLHQSDPALGRAAIFVFDEVHDVSDGARGWTLESVLGWLSVLSPETRTKKMLFMSGASEPSAEFKSWLTDDGAIESMTLMSRWRPTRQTWGVFDFPGMPAYASFPSPLGGGRRAWEGRGRITYLGSGEETRHYKRIDNIASTRQVVQWDSAKRGYRLVSAESTGSAEHAAELAVRAATLGSVLVYFPDVESLSQFVADVGARTGAEMDRRLPEEVLEFLSERLHPEYPLCRWIDRGVAFHHGRLPLDVRAEIERQYREGNIRVLAATTTLAEGVNLPTRTLIVAGTRVGGWADDSLSVQRFRNLLGRAGRALRETEGLALFVQNPRVGPNAIPGGLTWHDYFFPSENDLSPHGFLSELDDDDFRSFFALLNRLSELPEPPLVTESMVTGPKSRPKREQLADVARRMQAFLLAADVRGWLGDTDGGLAEAAARLLQATLTARTLPPEEGESLRRFVEATTMQVRKGLPTGREALSRTGLSPRSSSILLEIMDNLGASLNAEWPTDPRRLLRVLVDSVADKFPEVTPPIIRRGRGNSKAISIDRTEAAVTWTFDGVGPRQLGERFMNEISDINRRVEQAFLYVASVFEYRLPWILSAAATLLVPRLDIGAGSVPVDAPFQLAMLPAMVRFGVGSPSAAFLCALGVSSSRAAQFLSRKFLEIRPDGDRDLAALYVWATNLDSAEFEPDSSVSSLELKRAFNQLSRMRERSRVFLGSSEVTCFVSGWQYYRGPVVEPDLVVGEPLVLEVEPGNEYDANAVALYVRGAKVGYVPAALSKEVAAELRTSNIRGLVLAINKTAPPWERVEITLRRTA